MKLNEKVKLACNIEFLRIPQGVNSICEDERFVSA